MLSRLIALVRKKAAPEPPSRRVVMLKAGTKRQGPAEKRKTVVLVDFSRTGSERR